MIRQPIISGNGRITTNHVIDYSNWESGQDSICYSNLCTGLESGNMLWNSCPNLDQRFPVCQPPSNNSIDEKMIWSLNSFPFNPKKKVTSRIDRSICRKTSRIAPKGLCHFIRKRFLNKLS